MTSVIVLNAKWQYWDEVPVKRVLKWLCKNKVDVILQDEENCTRSANVTIRNPIIVKLLDFVGYKIKKKRFQYKDQHVYDRDRNVCQYWHYNEKGKKYKHQCNFEDRTIDHVIPKAQGGLTTFENCVCCCETHNYEKKNRTPKEAGLKLIRKPYVPESKVGDYVFIRFVYNPNKLSHQYYMEKFLNKKFNPIIF